MRGSIHDWRLATARQREELIENDEAPVSREIHVEDSLQPGHDRHVNSPVATLSFATMSRPDGEPSDETAMKASVGVSAEIVEVPVRALRNKRLGTRNRIDSDDTTWRPQVGDEDRAVGGNFHRPQIAPTAKEPAAGQNRRGARGNIKPEQRTPVLVPTMSRWPGDSTAIPMPCTPCASSDWAPVASISMTFPVSTTTKWPVEGSKTKPLGRPIWSRPPLEIQCLRTSAGVDPDQRCWDRTVALLEDDDVTGHQGVHGRRRRRSRRSL